MNPIEKESRGAGQIEGRYANNFKVGHNAFEFVLDFGQFYPEEKMVHLHTRVITSPVYAKTLLGTLQESVDKYEQTFGSIPREEG